MNRKQKLVVVVGTLVLVWLALRPPYTAVPFYMTTESVPPGAVAAFWEDRPSSHPVVFDWTWNTRVTRTGAHAGGRSVLVYRVDGARLTSFIAATVALTLALTILLGSGSRGAAE